MTAYKIILVRPFSKLKTKPEEECLGLCLYFFSRMTRSVAAMLHLCKVDDTFMDTNYITKYWWNMLQCVLNPYCLRKQAEGPPPALQSWQALLSFPWAPWVWASARSFESELFICLFLVCHLFSVTWPREADLSPVFQADHNHSFLCQKYFFVEVTLFF